MFSKYFENMNVGILPIITMIVFLIFFISLVIWALKADKNYIKKMSNLPLDSKFDSKKDEKISDGNNVK